MQAIISAVEIQQISSANNQLLNVNLASVMGGPLVNTPTAQSLPLWQFYFSSINLFNFLSTHKIYIK